MKESPCKQYSPIGRFLKTANSKGKGKNKNENNLDRGTDS